MRRSHRLALSAACALGLLVAAGTLATSAPSREAERLRAGDARAAAGAERVDSAAPVARAPRADANDTLAAARAERLAALALARADADAAAEDSRDPRRSIDADAEPIELDDPQIALGGAVAIHGRDPGSPRAVELWRLVGVHSARVAIGRSGSGGALEFPALVLPAGDVTLVASPGGQGPDSPLASAPVVASRDPSPPQLLARSEDADAATLALALEPAEPGGAIVIARAGAGVIARVPVGSGADASRAPLDVVVALAADDTELRIAQELPDGRRSPWRTVVLDSQSKENGDADAVADAK